MPDIGRLPVTFPRNVGQVPVYYCVRAGRDLSLNLPLVVGITIGVQ
ncbi:MAG: hypothetical protein MUC91_06500 [Verrucomicrobia bacterium]|nr:hypothetical protein [Verrucomicrobiota bacterium]